MGTYNPYDNVMAVVENAAQVLGYEKADYEALKYPERELKVSIPVQMDDGSTAYTRNGHFVMAVTGDGLALTDSNGHPVLDSTGKAITITGKYRADQISIDQNGRVLYKDANNNTQELGMRVGLAYFPNASGLEKVSDSNYIESAASGVPTIYTANDLGSKIVSGYLEASNVQAADEMVNMIIAQRAYEMNSKAITASDEMLQQANNLRS